jgi:RHS repeat-associated protein
MSFADTPMAEQGKQPYKYNGKELDQMHGLNMYDYSARHLALDVPRFTTVDPLAEKYYSWSPYSYVRNNPLLRLDPTGKWDVTVHAYKEREKYGYGILIVTNNAGKEVYRTNVRVEGTNSRENQYNRRIRERTYADTPVGTYKILRWSSRLPNKDRGAYGPNKVLELNYISGEASGKRNGIHAHGGRQEQWDPKTKKWISNLSPILKNTHGCIRMFDDDIFEMKEITDALEAEDSEEEGNFFYVRDDLESDYSTFYPPLYFITPRTESNGFDPVKFWKEISQQIEDDYNKWLKLQLK